MKFPGQRLIEFNKDSKFVKDHLCAELTRAQYDQYRDNGGESLSKKFKEQAKGLIGVPMQQTALELIGDVLRELNENGGVVLEADNTGETETDFQQRLVRLHTDVTMQTYCWPQRHLPEPYQARLQSGMDKLKKTLGPKAASWFPQPEMAV